MQIEMSNIDVNGEWVTRFTCLRDLEARPLWRTIDQLPHDEAVRWVDRFNPLEALFSECVTCQVFESAYKIDVPLRGKALRALLSETQRLVWLFDYLHKIFQAVGEVLVTEHLLRLREMSLEAMDLVTGSRVLPHVLRIGGTQRDLSIGEGRKLRQQLRAIEYEARFFLKDIDKDYFLVQRFFGVAPLPSSVQQALQLGTVLGQAHGLAVDRRITNPDEIFASLQMEFFNPQTSRDWYPMQAPTSVPGDVWQRVRSAIFQVRQSLRLVDILSDKLPAGPYSVESNYDGGLPDGMWVSTVEAASGPLTALVSKRGVRLSSHSSRLGPFFEKLVAPVRVDDLGVALAALGIDMGQVDL